MCVHVYFLSVFIETIKLIVVTKSSSDVWLYFSFMHGYFVFDAEVGDNMIMIILVWQPDGWISYKVQCKLQKKEK